MKELGFNTKELIMMANDVGFDLTETNAENILDEMHDQVVDLAIELVAKYSTDPKMDDK